MLTPGLARQLRPCCCCFCRAAGGSSRIQNPQRRKSGALKTPMQQGVAHAPTPHSTPLGDTPEKRRSDDLAAQADTPDSRHAAAAAASAGSGAKTAAVGRQSSGSLKVQVMGSPPVASPSKVRMGLLIVSDGPVRWRTPPPGPSLPLPTHPPPLPHPPDEKLPPAVRPLNAEAAPGTIQGPCASDVPGLEETSESKNRASKAPQPLPFGVSPVCGVCGHYACQITNYKSRK